MVKIINGQFKKKPVKDIIYSMNIYLNDKKNNNTSKDMIFLKDCLEEYDENLEQLKLRNDLFELVFENSNRGKGLKNKIKKVISKSVGWYFKDYYRNQREFNFYTMCAIANEREMLSYLLEVKEKEDF